MSDKRTALLAGLLAATMSEQERNEFYNYSNSYAGLTGLTYNGTGHKRYAKSPLTKRQKKSRAAAKRAKKARKRNR